MHDRQDRRQTTSAPSSSKNPSPGSPGRDSVFSILKDYVPSLSSVAGRRVAITRGTTPLIVVINSGMLMLSASQNRDYRIVTALLYAGDITSNSFSAPLPDINLTSLLPSQYLLLEAGELDELVAQNPEIIPIHSRCIANQLARTSLHAACLSLLTCQQKVATLLLELALNIGHKTDDGISVDVPLSRTDIAAYLALNVDTVSRTMTQIKSDGIITVMGRRHIIINNPKDLMRSTPLADATISLFSRSPLKTCFTGA